MGYIYSIGIDIGGTEIKSGVIEKLKTGYKLVIQDSYSTPYGKEKIKDLVKLVHEIVDKYIDLFPEISCVGIGIAGLIEIKTGKIIFAPNLDWENVELKKMLKFSVPVLIDNDANIAALGVCKHELKDRYKNVVCFTLGTGIGGGIVIDRKIYYGNIGIAGELGHITLFPDGEKCNCGNRGCIERYIGQRWFIESVKDKLKNYKRSTKIFDLINNNLDNLTPEVLYLAAEKNDIFARQQWAIYGKYLGVIVADIINILNPEVVVFTGGIANAHKYFLPFVKKEVFVRCRRLFTCLGEKSYRSKKVVRYYISSNSKNLGVIGAGIVALENVGLL